MNALIVFSLVILLLLLALPTLNQLVSCLRDAPEPSENNRRAAGQVVDRM